MGLMEIWYQAGEIEARALSQQPAARPTNIREQGRRTGSLRRSVGHALIGLGSLIAAEAHPTRRVV